MGDFAEHLGVTSGSRIEKIVELILKFEKVLGRPVERTEFTMIIRLLYQQIDENTLHMISKSITQARIDDIEFATAKDLQKTLRVNMPQQLFINELNKKTQKRLAGLKGTYVPKTNAKIELIKAQREKIKIVAGVPSFFIVKAKKEESLENLRRFWKEN